MPKSIDEPGLKEEIFRLSKEGLTVEKIREKLIETNPDVPSLSWMYKLLSDDTPRNEFNGKIPFEDNYFELKKKFDEFNDIAYKYCYQGISKDNKKFMNDASRKLKQSLEEFHEFYSQKEAKVNALLNDWSDELVNGMCVDCKKKVFPRLKELVQKDKEL